MNSQDLEVYIRQELNRGRVAEEIITELVADGYDIHEIEQVFKWISPVSEGPEKPAWMMGTNAGPMPKPANEPKTVSAVDPMEMNRVTVSRLVLDMMSGVIKVPATVMVMTMALVATIPTGLNVWENGRSVRDWLPLAERLVTAAVPEGISIL
jgi:hypothetical protein